MSLEEKEGFVTVYTERGAPMVARINAGVDTMTIDESGVAQGLKEGADPYDYILAALGACTAITLHMYAQRKGWPLERAEVSLRHERVHANDCQQCEEKEAKLNQVTKHLRLTGDLTEEQRKRLTVIASKCPVQKTLEAGIAITTHLLEEPV
ncbi:OsmC family protein [Pontibacter litorisediminis]|uniref:OsmC family protein n=1 Tax=Pontibacter litorisediminis TaxID=1846260 RepID=UPI0023EAB6CC|nr:OsmC family protein [Pontibacter litorisediminis]